MAQAQIGQNFLVQYCQALKALEIHTTINHHISMHYLCFIKLFGPVYGWWLFAFERFNGMLERVKTNGHDGGRMELTMLRQWVMSHLLYEYLLSLPEDGSALERAFLEKIILKEGRENRGGMMTDLARFRAETSLDGRIQVPRRLPKLADVSAVVPDGNAYPLLLVYLQNLWPELNIIDDNSLAEGTPFYRAKTCRPLTYITKDGIRYGSICNKRTAADSFAFISSEHGTARFPVQIIALLSVKFNQQPTHVCAIVQRMRQDDNLPSFPWDLL